MNRLTKRNEQGAAYVAIADTLPMKDQEIEGSKKLLEAIYAIFQKLAAYEDTGLEPEEIQDNLTDCFNAQFKVLEYINLEHKGLLIKLPCKVGQSLFTYSHIRGCIKEFIAPDKTWIFENTMLFGKEIFLTREEAENKLKEMEV